MPGRAISQSARERAEKNVEKWGLQREETLLLAMQEEMGELTQAHLEAEHEGGDPERLREELIDLMALAHQLDWRREEVR